MNVDHRDEHLSHITTLWTLVANAHGGADTEAARAQERLIAHYGPAIHRYLLGAVRDADLADELFQEFALRLVRGDLRRADPSRGRFRQFVKTTLYHLVVDAQRRRRRQASPLPEGDAAAAKEMTTAESDEQFLQAWRAELLARTWDALARTDRTAGQQLLLVLGFRRDHPEVKSPDMAAELARLLGKPVSPEWVRKRLHQARDRFADLLIAEVAQTLEEPTTERLEDELVALGLLSYCRDQLARRGNA